MRLFARTLMFLAFLLYATMPGMATAGMAMPTVETHDVQSHASFTGQNHGPGMAMASQKAHASTDPCPHKGRMTHAPFCAACLVLLPELAFAEKGRTPHAGPKPDLQRAFTGNRPAPPLPPPRA